MFKFRGGNILVNDAGLRINLNLDGAPTTVEQETTSSNVRIRDVGTKGEELRFQSQEDQELSVDPGPSQLILKMTSE
jgi:hypothetical protein